MYQVSYFNKYGFGVRTDYAVSIEDIRIMCVRWATCGLVRITPWTTGELLLSFDTGSSILVH